MNYALYNPLAQAGKGKEAYQALKPEILKKFPELNDIDVTSYDKDAFFKGVKAEDNLIVVGGDGTLNVFANNIKNYGTSCGMYYCKGGNGNDFFNDVKKSDDDLLIDLAPYFKRLPKITVNGRTQYYINGIGYGIDGMCCEVAEKMKAEGKTDISYAGLSIKLLFHGYKCPEAKAVVDGKEYSFHHVWLSSAMNGRYYGGGMKIAPEQDRLSDKLSLSVISNGGKLKTLLIFPKIFKGEHVKNKKMSTILTGKKITVSFSIPTALQIDGEVVSGVSEYTVESE